jgi:hypothetical protein
MRHAIVANVIMCRNQSRETRGSLDELDYGVTSCQNAQASPITALLQLHNQSASLPSLLSLAASMFLQLTSADLTLYSISIIFNSTDLISIDPKWNSPCNQARAESLKKAKATQAWNACNHYTVRTSRRKFTTWLIWFLRYCPELDEPRKRPGRNLGLCSRSKLSSVRHKNTMLLINAVSNASAVQSLRRCVKGARRRRRVFGVRIEFIRRKRIRKRH